MNRRSAVAASPWAVALVCLAVTGLSIARLQVVGNGLDRVWNEDGVIFLPDAFHHGLHSIFYVYAGYLAVLVRVLALLSRLLPLHAYAFYTVAASSLVTGVMAGFAYAAATVVIGSRAWALLAALSIVLTPALAVESLASLMTVQWFLIPATFWALLLPLDASPRLRAAGIVVAGVTAVTSTLSAILLPAALIWHGRAAREHWPLRVFVAGLVFQLVGIALFPHTPGGVVRHASVYAGLLRGFAEMLGPATKPPGSPHETAELVTGIALGLVLLACLFSVRDAPRGVWITWGTAVLMYLIPSIITGRAPARYEAAGFVFVVAGLALLGPRLDWRLAAIPLAILIVYAVNRFPVYENRVSGPAWTSVVRRFEAACRVPGVRSYKLPVAPGGLAVLQLECRYA